jgi:uncharacterized membrane protein YbhN (UPF0104 family)
LTADGIVQPRRPKPWRVALSIALGGGGIGVIAYFLHDTDLDQVVAVLAGLAAWLPLLLAIEGLRIGVEAIGTRALYKHPLPTGALIRAHVIGYSLAFYMPAGRAAAETVKATLLAKHSTVARATAVAAANQSLALLGLAIAALACLVAAATLPGTDKLVASLAVVAASTGTIGIVLRLATLRMRGRWVQRFAPKLVRVVEDARTEVPVFLPALTMAMFLVNRTLQLVAIAVLLHAVGGTVSVATVMTAGGVNLVGASLGDMVPGQLGTTDATFSVSARLLGLTPEAAISIALAIHVIQMTWMAIGLVIELAARLFGTVHGKRVV